MEILKRHSKIITIPELNIDKKENLIDKIAEYINTQSVIIALLQDDSTMVLHPYSFVINENAFYVLSYNDNSSKLSLIDIQEIVNVDVTNLKSYRKMNLDSVNYSKLLEEYNYESTYTMKDYWNAFNKNSTYSVGIRDQWYNEIRSIEFQNNDGVYFKTYIEICCQYGHQKQLLINLIVQARNKNSQDKIESQFSNLEKVFNKSATKTKGKIGWESYDSKENGLRRKTLLAQLKLDELDKKDNQNPEINPNRIKHFTWFQDRLKEIEEIFNQEIVQK